MKKLLQLFLFLAIVSAAHAQYVINPFESAAADNYFQYPPSESSLGTGRSYAKLSDTLCAKFGNKSLKVDWLVHANYTWGGRVDISHRFNQSSDSGKYMDFAPAKYISIWYKNIKPSSKPRAVEFRVILHEAGGESKYYKGGLPEDVEDWYFQTNKVFDDTGTEWKQLLIPIIANDPSAGIAPDDQGFTLPGWTGTSNNGSLDLTKIIGWRIEITSAVISSGDSTANGTVLFDHMQLLDSWYAPIETFENTAGTAGYFAIDEMKWSNGNQSALMLTDDNVEPFEGMASLKADWKIHADQTWGGYVNMAHNFPSTIDLSANDALYIYFKVNRASSVAKKVTCRFTIFDDDGEREEWISLLNADLDNTSGWTMARIPLDVISNIENDWNLTPLGFKIPQNKKDGEMHLTKIGGFKIEFSTEPQDPFNGGYLVDGSISFDLLIRAGQRDADKTPPASPTGLAAVAGKYKNIITWNDVPGEDLETYNVYYSTKPISDLKSADVNFVKARITENTGSVNHAIRSPLTDADVAYYYAVTCTDKSGNESQPILSPSPLNNKSRGVPTIALKTPGNFAADGNLKEFTDLFTANGYKPIAIKISDSTGFVSPFSIIDNDADCSAIAYLAMDKNYLYAAFDITDDIVDGTSNVNTYERDSPDLFIGLYNSKGRSHLTYKRGDEPDYHLRFNKDKILIENPLVNTFILPGINYIWKEKASGGYIAEAKIPLSDLANMREPGNTDFDRLFFPQEGMRIPIDFSINDADLTGAREGILTYSPDNQDNSWMDPQRWTYTWIGKTSSVDSIASITVLSPDGGESYRTGSQRQIKWIASKVTNVKIELTTNNGSSWTSIFSDVPASSGLINWTIPNTPSSQCKIKISDASNASVYDESDNSFSISLTGPITETEPNNSASTANYMEYGDSLDAAISPIGDVDYYKFTASAGDTIVVYSFDRNSSTLDGSIRLLNESGAELFYNDDFMSINASRIVYPVTSQGTYYIRYSYFQNYTGLQSASLPKGKNEFKNLLNKELKGPQLANDNGEYKINLKRFTSASPQLSSFGWYYLNYNAIRLAIGLYPNGLPTTVRLDYGTTSGYGNNFDLTQSPVNSLNEFYIPYLLNGLQANTTYHFRVTLTNSKGTYVSGDMSLTTPSVPEGYVFQTSGTENSLYSVSFADQNNGSAVGDYVILHTTNGGVNWNVQNTPVNTYFRSVSFTDQNNGTAVGGNGVILKTTNAGAAWTQQSSGVINTLNSVYFTDLNNGTAVGDRIILHTTNGGTTWTQQTIPNTQYYPNLTAVSFTDQNNGTVIGGNGIILKTTNAGATWTQQSSGTGNWLYGVCFTDQNNGTAVGENVILRTTNGGTTWVQQSIPNTQYYPNLTAVSFTDQNNGTVVGGNGIILKTTNAGAAWTQPSSGTTAWLNSLSTKNNNTVIVGDWGMILKASSSSSPVKWQVSLNISDGNSQNSNSLTFGQARTATDGLDAALGEITLPPAPPSGVFDARFKLPVTPAEYSLKDYRADTLKSVDWRLSFQPGSGGYPLTFTWNPSNLPEGAVYLKDVINGSIINVNMKSQSSYTLSDEDITSLKIEFRTEICSNVVLSNDWNMISVPVNSPDMQSSVLFPQATSPTYGFSGSYQSQSTLETGRGYWIRYPQSEVVSICGAPVSQSNSLKVTAGWNLVGVFDRNIQVNQITAQPEGILSSPFYGYMGSYQSATELQSGRGYWIRSSQSGVINLNYSSSSSALAKENTIPPEVKGDWGKIIVEDNIGRRAVLYRSLNEANLFKYDLPPMPPLGIFDVRYTTDRYVETAGNSKIKISSAAFPVKIKSEGMDLRIKDNIGGSILNKLLRKGETFTINNNQLDLLSVETVEIPLQYELSQNYPNPFNPSTTIRYAIPEKTQLSLTIYNQLGEKVKELVNTVMEAGEYHLEWNAENCASGIYLCELKTQSFRSVRKLILLK